MTAAKRKKNSAENEAYSFDMGARIFLGVLPAYADQKLKFNGHIRL